MKKLVCLLAMFCLAVTLFAQDQKPQREDLKLGSAMPEINIKSEVNGNITPADLKGKVVLINLFATWCPPCQKELAEVKATLWPKYKNNKNFKMLVIGREHTDADLTKYNEKKGFEFPLYPDPKRGAYSKFADSTIPRAYLYNKEGKLVYSSIGYSQEEFAKLLKAIEEAL